MNTKALAIGAAALIGGYFLLAPKKASASPAHPSPAPVQPSFPAPLPVPPAPQVPPNPFLNDPENGPFTGLPTGQTPGGIEPGNPGAFTDQDIATMGNPDPGSQWTAGVSGLNPFTRMTGASRYNPFR